MIPSGWRTLKLSEVMERREELAEPEEKPNDAVTVMTISQTGEIRQREAGKGINPPEWLQAISKTADQHPLNDHQGTPV